MSPHTRHASLPAWSRCAHEDVRARLAATPVVVLYGGTSSEREVSLVSGGAVLEALGRAVDDACLGGLSAVEVRPDGFWSTAAVAGPAPEALAGLAPEALLFLGLHGGRGENGVLQGFLETAGRSYTGSGVDASALCMNKSTSRAVFQACGLRTAPGLRVGPRQWRERGTATLAGLPPSTAGWYVKPNRGGSSVATFAVGARRELGAAIERVLDTGDDALVEATVEGLEATVGVIGNRGSGLTALPPVEIHPRSARFFDYAEKYGEGGAEEICPPRNLDARSQAALAQAALAAYAASGCDGYARIDFIVPHAHPTEPVVLEANTLPGFTPRSLLPQAARVAGLDFRWLCLELCALALERHDERTSA